jgi:hypothetical protein
LSPLGTNFTKPSHALFFISTFLHIKQEQIFKWTKFLKLPKCIVFCSISKNGHARCPQSIQKEFGTSGAYFWFSNLLSEELKKNGIENNFTEFVFFNYYYYFLGEKIVTRQCYTF